MDVQDWYVVEFDDQKVRLQVHPPGQLRWEQEIPWERIERVCLKVEDFLVSDGLYIFVRGRRESYATPVEARGGQELLDALIERGLFTAELAIEAAGSPAGRLFCWPPPDGER